MKILVDMNLTPRWAEVFVLHDIEAIHWSKIGAGNAADFTIMEFAYSHGYTILTHDLDFSAMLALNRKNKPSLIQLRTGKTNPDSAYPMVISAIRQASDEIEAGAILTIELNKARLRILPLR